jgi:signal transduction histidine kinase
MSRSGRDALLVSDERLSKLVRLAAHELKTPLVSISGYSELAAMRSAELPPPVGDWMQAVQRSARRLQVGIDRLVLAVRPRDLLLGRSPEAPGAAVSAALKPARRDMDAQRVLLDVGDIPASYVQPSVVAECVAMLVENAIQHAFPDGRHGRVEVRGAARPDGGLRLEVSDDGIGIPAERQAVLGSLDVPQPGLGWAVLFAVGDRLGGWVGVAPSVAGTRAVLDFPGPLTDTAAVANATQP